MTVLSGSRPVPAPSGLIATIERIANAFGIDPNLALATALAESNLNPNAVGDGGTSFGLFQLHQGGELGSMTSTQAFNPVTNTTTALAEFRAVIAANPNGFATPGDLAAAAQRPADRTGYATEVNYYYNQLQSGIPVQNITAYNGTGQAIAGAGATTAQLTSAQIGNSNGGNSNGGCGAKGTIFGGQSLVVTSLPKFTYCNLKAITGGLILVAGGVLCVVGIAVIASSAFGPRNAVAQAAKAATPAPVQGSIPRSEPTYLDASYNSSGGRAKRQPMGSTFEEAA